MMEINMFSRIIVLLCTVVIQCNSQPPYFGDPGSSPVLDTMSVDVTAKLGQKVVLPCLVTNRGDTIVSWITLKSYSPLTENGVILEENARLSIEGEFNLVIENVQEEDAGSYTCMVQSFPPQMKDVTLIIKVPASIDTSSLKEMYTKPVGSKLNITCPVTGKPDPVVNWYVYTMENEDIKELKSEDQHLIIPRLQRQDAGIYRCEAENKYGKDMYEVYIDPTYAPRVTTTTPYVPVKWGQEATLQCEVTSNPSPTANLKWIRDGTELEYDWKYHITIQKEEKKTYSKLVIQHAEQADNGEYVCLSKNIIGSAKAKITVKVIYPTTTTQSITTTMQTTVSQKPGNIVNTESSTTSLVGPQTGEARGQSSSLHVNNCIRFIVCALTFLLAYL